MNLNLDIKQIANKFALWSAVGFSLSAGNYFWKLLYKYVLLKYL